MISVWLKGKMNIISIVSLLQLVVPAVSLLVPSTKVIEPCSALTAREGSIGSSVNCFAGAFPSYESDIDDFQIRNQGVSRRSMLTRFLGFLTMSVTTQGTALAAEPVTAKDTDSLLVVAKRKFRPKPPKLLRRRLSQDFAVLLMRSSYNALDELDCVAMDQFQRDFFLIRSSEYETYTNALGNGLVQQGDLTDPYYFDFISFVQYKTINRELTENPPYVFEEQQLITEGAAEDEAGRARFVPVVVKRDPGLTNAMLVPTHASKVGAKILDRFEEMFGQSDARIPNVDKNSNSGKKESNIKWGSDTSVLHCRYVKLYHEQLIIAFRAHSQLPFWQQSDNC